MAIGVVFSVKSALGVSPVTCLANVLYQIASHKGWSGIGLGMCTTASYCLYILVELIILRRDFEAKMLLQIIASFFFGFLVSCATRLFAFLPAPETYGMRMVFLLCSVPLVALGVMLYLAPQILPTPGEGMSLAISKKTGLTVASSKIIFDCSMVLVSALTSLLYFHRLVGVREGTIICALTVGFVMKLFMRVCQKPLMAFVERETKLQQIMNQEHPYAVDSSGKPKLLISIGWEFGSGGYEIAQELAKRLGIRFYGNDELIPLEAQESGLPESFIHKHEHNMAHSVVYDFMTAGYAMHMELSPLEKLFAAQVKIIRRIAAQDESAVLVGRCSDYILYKDPNSFRIFIHAPTDERVRRVASTMNISAQQAAADLATTDASRSRHYEHFTGRKWGDTCYYNLAVDTNMFGLTGSLELIEDAIRHWCEARGQSYQDIVNPITDL
jgi:uncharacterized membrane protein YczE